MFFIYLGNNKFRYFFLIAFHLLSVPLPCCFFFYWQWCSCTLMLLFSPSLVRGLDLIADSVICLLGAKILSMLEWCLNSSIRHLDSPDACPAGSSALGKNGRSLVQTECTVEAFYSPWGEAVVFHSFQKQNQSIL